MATNTLPRPSSSQTSANPKSRKSRNKIDRLSASPSTAGVTNYAKVLGLFAESSASSDISHTSGGASTSISWPVWTGVALEFCKHSHFSLVLPLPHSNLSQNMQSPCEQPSVSLSCINTFCWPFVSKCSFCYAQRTNLRTRGRVDAQMHQDSNVRSLMRFAKLYNLELHLMTKVEHEKHVKPSLQSLGSASIQPRKSHLKVNVPLLK